MKNEIVYDLELLIVTANQLQRTMKQIGVYVSRVGTKDSTLQYNQAMLKQAITLMDYSFDINIYVMFVKTMVEFVSIVDVVAYQELLDRALMPIENRLQDLQTKFNAEVPNESGTSVCKDTGSGEGSNNAGGDPKSN